MWDISSSVAIILLMTFLYPSINSSKCSDGIIVVRRKIQNEGFHNLFVFHINAKQSYSCINYSNEDIICSASKKGLCEERRKTESEDGGNGHRLVDGCRLIINQSLPSGLYVDTEQLDELLIKGKLPNYYLNVTEVDVEAAQEVSSPFVITLVVDYSFNTDTEEVVVPIHKRYHQPHYKKGKRIRGVEINSSYNERQLNNYKFIVVNKPTITIACGSCFQNSNSIKEGQNRISTSNSVNDNYVKYISGCTKLYDIELSSCRVNGDDYKDIYNDAPGVDAVALCGQFRLDKYKIVSDDYHERHLYNHDNIYQKAGNGNEEDELDENTLKTESIILHTKKKEDKEIRDNTSLLLLVPVGDTAHFRIVQFATLFVTNAAVIPLLYVILKNN